MGFHEFGMSHVLINTGSYLIVCIISQEQQEAEVQAAGRDLEIQATLKGNKKVDESIIRIPNHFTLISVSLIRHPLHQSLYLFESSTASLMQVFLVFDEDISKMKEHTGRSQLKKYQDFVAWWTGGDTQGAGFGDARIRFLRREALFMVRCVCDE